MNKHIELVKKWLNDPSSVSQEELVANSNAAYEEYYEAADEAYASYAATDYATYVAAADAATYWVNEYRGLTNE